MTKLYDLDKGQTASDLVEELADLPQPLYLYYYDDTRGDWLVISEVEIPDDDLESVIFQLIENYDEENDNEE